MYVRLNSENPVEPYDTPETASKTVNAAAICATNLVALAEAAGEDLSVEILVGAGTNNVSSQIYVGKNVTLRGATGNRDEVVIRQTSNATSKKTNCRVLYATGSGAVVADLTIMGGSMYGNNAISSWNHLERSGAGAWLGSYATITNCRITACKALGGCGAGMFVNTAYAYDVLVDHCGVRNNNDNYTNRVDKSFENRGYAVGVTGDSTVDRCQIVDNWAQTVKAGGSNTFGGALAVNNESGSNSKVRNCLIARNEVKSGATNSSYKYATGVSIRGGYLDNCTIVSNRSDVLSAHFVGLSVYNPTTAEAEFVRNCHVFDNYYSDATFNSANKRQWAGKDGTLNRVSKRITYCLTYPTTDLGDGCASCEGDTKWEFDEKGRFKLLAGSPCINKGTTNGTTLAWIRMPGATDLYGNPRIHSKGPEIGAVEFITHGLTIIMK